MQITLNDRWIQYCQGQPETGMGYQAVIVHTSSGSEVDGMIYNCSILETPAPVRVEDIASIDVIQNRPVDNFGVVSGQ